MVESMMPIRQKVATNMLRCMMAVCCTFSSVLSFADSLPDPTRPPAMIRSPMDLPSSGAKKESQPTGLQTVIISDTRRVAVIDGKTVPLGASHGNAKLIAVNEGSVMLRNSKGQRELTMFPDVKIIRRNTYANKLLFSSPLPVNEKLSGEYEPKPMAHEEEK